MEQIKELINKMKSRAEIEEKVNVSDLFKVVDCLVNEIEKLKNDNKTT